MEALYGILISTVETVVAMIAEGSVGQEVLWKSTVKFEGGFCAQSKKKDVMGW